MVNRHLTNNIPDTKLSYFLDIAESRARLTPKRIAVVDYSWGKRESYTYEELNNLANTIAIKLMEYGINQGDIVSVLSYTSTEYLLTFLATPKVGFILAPLNWRLSPSEISFMIDDVKPKIVFYHSELEKLLKHSIDQATHKPEAIIDIEELRKLNGRRRQVIVEKPSLELESPQMLLYTGGTTGRPKAAIISYRQTLYNAINTVLSWGLTPEDIAPVFFPFFHSGGWHVITIPLYLIGGRIILTRKFDPDEAIDIIEKEKCTVVIAVPTMFFAMTKSKKFKEAKFESVRFFKSGGGMSSLKLMKAYWDKGKSYFQGYGLTEAGPNLFYTPNESKNKPMTIGKPALFTDAKIVKEDGSLAKPGEVGELRIRGPIVFTGYWNRPNETKETIVDGWVRTGDLFTRDEDNYYYFIERKKFMIKSGGENVYPTEVEEAIRQHPAVDDVAVFGVPDPKWGEAVAAVVKLKDNTKLTLDELKSFLKQIIAGYKIPKYLWIVDEIPKTPVGKINYTLIKKTYSKKVSGE